MTPGETIIKCCCELLGGGSLPPTGDCVIDGNAPSCERRIPLSGEPHDFITLPQFLIVELPLTFRGYGPLTSSPAYHDFELKYRSDYVALDTVLDNYLRMPLWNPGPAACPKYWFTSYGLMPYDCDEPVLGEDSQYEVELFEPDCGPFYQLKLRFGSYRVDTGRPQMPGIPCLIPRGSEPSGYYVGNLPTFFDNPDPPYDPPKWCLTDTPMPWDYPDPMTWIWNGNDYKPPPFGGSTTFVGSVCDCDRYIRICPGAGAPLIYCASLLALDDSMAKTANLMRSLYYEAVS